MNEQTVKDQDYWRGKAGEPVQRTCNLGFEWLPKNFNPLETFDADKWAAHFLIVLRDNPDIIIDHQLMVSWFANALMRGFDEHNWRTVQYKRSVRRALFPWWNWKHWAVADRLFPKLLSVDCQ